MIDTLYSEGGTSRLHKTHRPHLNTGAQFTPRIERLLPIIGEQGAIAFDHLQRWCARLSPATEFMREPGVLSAERTRKVLRPWVDEGILTCKVFFASQKAWWWLTPNPRVTQRAGDRRKEEFANEWQQRFPLAIVSVHLNRGSLSLPLTLHSLQSIIILDSLV